jgi:hypothetical protein
LWGAFDLPPHPALIYVVTVPVDLDITFQSPLVLTRTARYKRIAGDEVIETDIHIGGVMRDTKG